MEYNNLLTNQIKEIIIFYRTTLSITIKLHLVPRLLKMRKEKRISIKINIMKIIIAKYHLGSLFMCLNYRINMIINIMIKAKLINMNLRDPKVLSGNKKMIKLILNGHLNMNKREIQLIWTISENLNKWIKIFNKGKLNIICQRPFSKINMMMKTNGEIKVKCNKIIQK